MMVDDINASIIFNICYIYYYLFGLLFIIILIIIIIIIFKEIKLCSNNLIFKKKIEKVLI